MTNIAVMDAAGGEGRLLTHEAERDREWGVAGFTEGGGALIANRGDFNNTANQVFRITVTDGSARPLTSAQGFVRASAAKPDGSVIAVTWRTAASGRRPA